MPWCGRVLLPGNSVTFQSIGSRSKNWFRTEQDLARIEVEAKQKITQAQAEAESIKLVQEALSASPDYVEYIKWNKWDGKLPSVMGGNSDLLIGIDELTNGEE